MKYFRTPIYEPSLRAMCLPLSEIRKQLEMDRKSNEEFNCAWNMAQKLYKTKSSIISATFTGPEEYCIALICFTLDDPFNEDFKNQCQQLGICSFYLLIGAEMRLRSVNEIDESGTQLLRNPITNDLDHIIEENGDVSSSDEIPQKRVDPRLKRPTHRVYRGLEFGVDETEFKPRSLVAFSQLIPATLDGQRLTRMLSEKRKRVTLIEIDQISWSSRYIGPLSVFPIEKEVIIWPWIKFYVEERKMIGNNIEKIVLKPTSQSFLGNSAI
ncbi:hypothetical protein Ocin01_08898 [Orchesella cincta]|uniref:Uncharacterized protein n=1 Tax=Orchesella cincta TaxID=48709 RepID=A0A1D2MXW6_ORCCI|nr:hypothetical protein Ocin01_08898 [Orchesella cincta]